MTGYLRSVRRRWADSGSVFDRRLIAPMILGAILNPVNSSIIAVSLVPIGVAFGAPPAETAWLVSALYVATAIGQPVVGRLVDIYGPRKLYLVGTTLIGIAGALGVVAPSLGVLIIARVLLGFGTCAGYPAAMYLIRSEARRTGHDSPAGILTVLAVSTQTIAVIGPTLGGLLIGLGGWRATIAVNLPLSVACLVLGTLYLPRHGRANRTRSLSELDFAGMLLFATMLVTLLLFLMHPNARDWYLVALAVAAGTGLAWWELRTADPFLDLRVLGGNLPLLATYGRTLLTYVVSYAVLYGFSQWLEEGRRLTASQAGLVLLPVFGVGMIVSITTGRRKELRGKLLVGGVAQIVACVLLLLLGDTSPILLLVAATVVFGVPQGLNSLALQNSVYHQADPERIGSSAGLLRTFTYLGAMISSAATGAFFNPRASTTGLHHLGLFMLVVSTLFLVVTAVDRSLSNITKPKHRNETPTRS